MRKRHALRSALLMALLAVVAPAAACTAGREDGDTPKLAQRDTTMTTVRPTRQNLSNKVSLAGKVTMNPVYGLVAPVDGQVRYFDVQPPRATPVRATRVANVWAAGRNHPVDVPAGSSFAGRLVEDRSTVSTGMPLVSARYAGYGIVADIDGAQAYKLSDALTSVQAQIKSGPGPFACTLLGTIAALPEGTVPVPPPPSAAPSAPANGPPGGFAVPGGPGAEEQPPAGSEPTGLRLVCTAPPEIKLINGAGVTIEVITQSATNALVLPVEAVAGSQGNGKVDVVRADGTRETRNVVLGLTDGKVIEIRTGLTGDENIAVPAPNLPAPKPGTDAPGVPGGGPGK